MLDSRAERLGHRALVARPVVLGDERLARCERQQLLPSEEATSLLDKPLLGTDERLERCERQLLPSGEEATSLLDTSLLDTDARLERRLVAPRGRVLEALELGEELCVLGDHAARLVQERAVLAAPRQRLGRVAHRGLERADVLRGEDDRDADVAAVTLSLSRDELILPMCRILTAGTSAAIASLQLRTSASMRAKQRRWCIERMHA